MPYDFFYRRCPEMAKRETRTITLGGRIRKPAVLVLPFDAPLWSPSLAMFLPPPLKNTSKLKAGGSRVVRWYPLPPPIVSATPFSAGRRP